MEKHSEEIVSRISSYIPPIGMTLTEEEGEEIMRRVAENVYGAVHSGFFRGDQKTEKP
jgi:hypothetical protein